MAIMSQTAYSRHRGVAVRAVQKAIEAGRITTLSTGQIDSDRADEEWEQNTRGYTTMTSDDEGGFGASQYAKARAVREHYQARLAKLEFEQRTGKLVSVDEVRVAAFNKFRQFRDHILNIPDRVAAMVAAETEAAKCYEILAIEIRKALNEPADSNS